MLKTRIFILSIIVMTSIHFILKYDLNEHKDTYFKSSLQNNIMA